MLSSSFTTSTVEILSSIESSIRNNIASQGILKDINFTSLGYLQNPSAYPHLVITPLRDRVLRFYTEGFMDVERTIRFSVMAKKENQAASFGQSNGLINSIRLLFSKKRSSDFWRLKSLDTNNFIVFNTTMDEIVSPDPLVIDGAFFTTASIDISFLTQSKVLNSRYLYYPNLQSTSPKELTKIYYEVLQSYKHTLLSNIKTFKYGVSEPLSGIKYPMSSIFMGLGSSSPDFAGADVLNSRLTVMIFNTLYNKRESILELVSLIEKIRDITILNKYMFNRCFDYSIGEINYGIAGNTEEQLYYVGQLDIDTKSFEPLQ